MSDRRIPQSSSNNFQLLRLPTLARSAGGEHHSFYTLNSQSQTLGSLGRVSEGHIAHAQGGHLSGPRRPPPFRHNRVLAASSKLAERMARGRRGPAVSHSPCPVLPVSRVRAYVVSCVRRGVASGQSAEGVRGGAKRYNRPTVSYTPICSK